jgi:hypothetical protein
VYCLGDLAGYNIWPNEVTKEIKKRGIPTIAGNYDYGIGRNSDDSSRLTAGATTVPISSIARKTSL